MIMENIKHFLNMSVKPKAQATPKPMFKTCIQKESSRSHNYNMINFSQSLMNVVNLVEMTMTMTS